MANARIPPALAITHRKRPEVSATIARGNSWPKDATPAERRAPVAASTANAAICAAGRFVATYANRPGGPGVGDAGGDGDGSSVPQPPARTPTTTLAHAKRRITSEP